MQAFIVKAVKPDACDVSGICKGMSEEELKAFNAGLEAGAALGAYRRDMELEGASDVVRVFRNGDHTVLAFADGSRSKVTYHSEYGYPYDEEKAFLSALLKRLIGNRYVKMLREFCAAPAPEGAKTNVSGGMIPRVAPEGTEVVLEEDDGFPDSWGGEAKPVDVEDDGIPEGNGDLDAEFMEAFHALSEEEDSFTAGA